LIKKRTGFQTPIGKRKFDVEPNRNKGVHV